MNEIKWHSPAPWTVGGHPNDGSGTMWRNVLHPSQFGPTYVCSAVLPDAILIAAAPELLEACVAARKLIEDRWPEENRLLACEVLSQLDDVINKARGAYETN